MKLHAVTVVRGYRKFQGFVESDQGGKYTTQYKVLTLGGEDIQYEAIQTPLEISEGGVVELRVCTHRGFSLRFFVGSSSAVVAAKELAAIFDTEINVLIKNQHVAKFDFFAGQSRLMPRPRPTSHIRTH